LPARIPSLAKDAFILVQNYDGCAREAIKQPSWPGVVCLAQTTCACRAPGHPRLPGAGEERRGCPVSCRENAPLPGHDERWNRI